ncbi:hypothetical protein GCM10009827_119030 [Dactylosporangium maewongense]|uniref:Uncharacterized protein n=1 Tax=Dactylosporangium maewongense TaxID=634393 RepID=A0ABN2DH22_9ACTN
MLSTPEPPALADDAYTCQITAKPVGGEYGVHTFGRAITTHLRDLLHADIEAPRYRENRRDERQLPKACTWTCTVAGHTVVITGFEVKLPLLREPEPVYAIHVDDVRVPFEVSTYRDVDWQLARTVWIAVDDLRIAADRQARDAADAPQPGDAPAVTS